MDPLEAARKKVIILGYVALVLCVMAVTASFAWMSISSTPTVTDLALSVVSDNALEIAPDNNGTPGAWSSILDLSEVSELSDPLKPATFVAEENAFYAPRYGLDGRVDFSNPVKLTEANGKLIEGTDAKGYLYTATFWIRTSSSYCDVGLTPAMRREEGIQGEGCFLIGEPVWNQTRVCHEEAGNGSDKAVRIMIHAEATENDPEQWIMYEPSTTEGQETLSVRGGKLEGDNRLIRQKASTWTETTPILNDSVIYKPGDFLDNTKGIFSLEPNVSRKITIYLWVEGQDDDCTSEISGGRVFGNLQFTGEQNENTALHAE